MSPSPNYDKALAIIEQRLWYYNPHSFYSREAIDAYVAEHFEFVNPNHAKKAPSPGIIDWNERGRVVARLISHLSPYAQVLLIETGCDLKLYPNQPGVQEEYNKKTDKDVTVVGFYDPPSHSVHWHIGDNSCLYTFLHEVGHAIDWLSGGGYLANREDINLDLVASIGKHLRISSSECAGIVCKVFSQRDLAEHLQQGKYKKSDFPTETVAELFAVRTILQWRFHEHPEQADRVMAREYPEIWPTLRDKYLPKLEAEADALYNPQSTALHQQGQPPSSQILFTESEAQRWEGILFGDAATRRR